MAKPVITIVKSLRNIRITYVPLLTVICNAVGIFLSQSYHADKLVSEHSPAPLALSGIACFPHTWPISCALPLYPALMCPFERVGILEVPESKWQIAYRGTL